jgi:hypothetical protein
MEEAVEMNSWHMEEPNRIHGLIIIKRFFARTGRTQQCRKKGRIIKCWNRTGVVS